MSLCPLLDLYLRLVDDTESPTIFHRWSFLTCVAASLGRRTKFGMATGDVYPNMYTVLLGPPGARKSTSIRMATDIVKMAGYRHISSGKTSPEQFLMDLQMGFDTININMNAGDMLDIADRNLSVVDKCSHALIEAGELQDFLGVSNLSFITLLTNLWDNPADYPYRLKGGTMELIKQPTVSIIGGATSHTFRRVFPPDTIGQGTLSRFILVHSGGRRRRVFEPTPLCQHKVDEIVSALSALNQPGIIPKVYKFDTSAKDFSRAIYESGEGEITDVRFQHYANRRNDHYTKLAMVIAALNFHQEITLPDCLLANTILTYTEKFMPLAMGEFGLDKGAERTEYLYQLISKYPHGINLKDLIDQGISIFGGGPSELAAHIYKLEASGRVEKLSIAGVISYIAIARVVQSSSQFVDFGMLTEYVENPTFNTQLVDQSRIDELQIQADILREVQTVKTEAKGNVFAELQVDPALLTKLKPAKR